MARSNVITNKELFERLSKYYEGLDNNPLTEGELIDAVKLIHDGLNIDAETISEATLIPIETVNKYLNQ